MKKAFAWVLRILCLVIITAAAVTVIRCILHVHDDYSYEAVMGHPQVLPEAAAEAPDGVPSPEPEEASGPETAQPGVTLAVDGSATLESPQVEVTASFTGIENSLQAELRWYLDGSPLDDAESRLLVDGASVTRTIQVDVADAEDSEAVVELEVAYEGGSVSAGTVFPVEQPAESGLAVRTEEITVTCIQDCSIYRDSDFKTDTGKIMYAGDTGLLLGYESGGEDGLPALLLQFPDGTEGWVSARRNEITQENCTTDQDYTDVQKVEFVNAMGYESATDYLVWVNLYTQRVNVFTGHSGDWELVQSFPCASGVNATPTTTGMFTLSTLTGHWDLAGGVYVDPVMIFNGGEAFTSQPKDAATKEVTDDTMGTPASGGSVRMLEEDITWMSRNLSVGTTVVVY